MPYSYNLGKRLFKLPEAGKRQRGRPLKVKSGLQGRPKILPSGTMEWLRQSLNNDVFFIWFFFLFFFFRRKWRKEEEQKEDELKMKKKIKKKKDIPQTRRRRKFVFRMLCLRAFIKWTQTNCWSKILFCLSPLLLILIVI